MRPHNSGHWSMDGAVTGQFEQHLRAVPTCRWGSVAARALDRHGQCARGGDDEELYSSYRHVMARDPGAKVHLYGRASARSQDRPRQCQRRRPREPARTRGHAAAYIRRKVGGVTQASGPVVGIVMGSDSDWPVMEAASIALTEFGIDHEVDVVRRTGCRKR